MNTHADKIFECRYFLTPAECNPQGRMPITLLINRLIEVATLHANAIGIGYDTLVDRHETWVLSRVAVEMTLYPGVNDHYTVRTWVSSINRLFSDPRPRRQHNRICAHGVGRAQHRHPRRGRHITHGMGQRADTPKRMPR